MSNTVTRLKQEYREAILNDAELHGKVAKATNKSWNTIYRWCNDNAEQLIMLTVIRTVREYLGIDNTISLVEEITEPTQA
ncbi:MAG TPA: hypothetical protein VG603_01365 [Chitinophagales bacterium]|nr:hypothetical protein [Chitinophagales bacterium]